MFSSVAYPAGVANCALVLQIARFGLVALKCIVGVEALRVGASCRLQLVNNLWISLRECAFLGAFEMAKRYWQQR